MRTRRRGARSRASRPTTSMPITSATACGVAARENGILPSQVDALQRTVAKLRVSEVSVHSRRVANAVHQQMVAGLAGRYGEVNDLGVKKGPFYVLFLSNMPAILVEAGFLTNRGEARRLGDVDYLDDLASRSRSGSRATAMRARPWRWRRIGEPGALDRRRARAAEGGLGGPRRSRGAPVPGRRAGASARAAGLGRRRRRREPDAFGSDRSPGAAALRVRRVRLLRQRRARRTPICASSRWAATRGAR